MLIQTDRADAVDTIRATLDCARNRAERQGSRPLLAQIHEAYAELGRCLGDDDAHERELREAHRLYTEIGATGHAERVGGEWGLSGRQH